ncbi:MAG TPA: M20/M25/M40 family metallo-hydrolase [Agriterribacter sp.]|nr:M20/M25/M40 family metallo-hydrolase [Agriterribacter sp.]
MKYVIALTLSFSCSIACSQSSIHGRKLVKNIEYLASDALEGRFPGTKGNNLADEYIKKSFKKNGIDPLYERYDQPFEVIAMLNAPTAFNYIQIKNDSALVINKDYSIFPFSGSAIVEAPLFWGESNAVIWNNPGQINHHWVLLWRNQLAARAPDSLSDYVLAKKASDLGAAGVILVTPDSVDNKDLLVKLRPRKDELLSVPAIQVKRTAWAQLKNRLFPGVSTDNGFHLSAVPLTASVKVEPETVTAKNIVGIIRGNDPKLKNEYIVLGAHYDHLGYGGYGTGSLKPDTVAIHNGADDNASGTSALLEIAAELARHKKVLKRSVIVVAFSAEEEGLLGSQYFTDHLPVPDSAIRVMLNMDMVGRLNTENQLYMGGAGTFPGGVEFMKSLGEGSGLNLVVHAGGVGGSDHVSFYRKGISCIGLHTGGHPQYHTPADDADLINVEGIEKVARYIYRAVYGLSVRTGEWGFVKQD